MKLSELQGRSYPSFRYEVAREKVRELAAALGDAATPDTGPLVAPPTFTILPALRWDRGVLTEGALPDHLLHTGQTFVLHRPVEVGMALLCEQRIDRVVERSTVTLVTVTTACRDDSGPVADLSTAIVVPATVTPDSAKAAARPEEVPAVAPPPADADPGTVVPLLDVVVDQALVLRYAAASGDLNPLHWDAAHAARVSPTGAVVAHGMLALGLAASALARWAGSPAAVTELSGSFRAPLPVGDRLRATAQVTGRGGSSLAVRLSAWRGDGALVLEPRRSAASVTTNFE